MSDFGNTASPSGDIGPDRDPENIHPATPYPHPSEPYHNILEEHVPTQEPPMNPSPSLDEQGLSDMNAITDAFDRARNAVINASQLAKDVAELREAVEAIRRESQMQVDSLRSEVETLRGESASLRERNAMLDEHLIHARRQRDEERERNYALTRQLSDRTTERDSLVIDLAAAREVLAGMDKKVAGLLTDNDHFVQMVDELEKERDALRSKLAAIQAVFAPQPSGQQPQGPQPDHYEEPKPQPQTTVETRYPTQY